MKHIIQLTDTTCGHACVAMLSGKTVDEVLRHFPERDDKGMVEHEARDALRTYGFATAQLTDADEFPPDGLFLTTVPSLNIPGGLHFIVIRARDGMAEVFDPNMGRDGKRYYSAGQSPDRLIKFPVAAICSTVMVWRKPDPAKVTDKKSEIQCLQSRVVVLRGKLSEVGVCPDCFGEIVHHMDEPFSSCHCGTGEDTGRPPIIQQLRQAANIKTG